MKIRLPWWLGVILGWFVILVLVIDYGFIVAWLSPQDAFWQPSFMSSAWYLTLLVGGLVTLVLSIAIGRRLYSMARAHSGGCAFTSITPLLLLFSLFLSFFSPLRWLFAALLGSYNPFNLLWLTLSRYLR